MRQPSRRNFWLNLAGGSGLVMAWEFGNPQLVLPWISHHLPAAYILVALLVPLYQGGLVASQLLVAPLVARMSLRKQAVSTIGLVLAGLFALIYAIASVATPALAAVSLLLCAGLVGVSFGVLNITTSDLQAKTVARRVRGKVLAQGTAIGGALTLCATFLIWTLVPDLAGNHLILLWLAVGGWLGFAAAYRAVREVPSETVAKQSGLALVRQGLSLVTLYPWFSRYIAARVLLLSVELSVPFYAIHAASMHGPSARNLSVFVVAMSLGMILGGPVWGRLLDRHTSAVAVSGALLVAVIGVGVLVMDQLGDPAAPFTHAFLFLPLAFAVDGVIHARIRWISVKAPAADRPALLALSSALLACAGILVALALGAAGHLHDIRTPLVILIALNVVAAIYVARVFGE
ncbi:MAG: hypothetical protein AAF637_03690 [Pseudomonadota bacterium]